MKLSHALLYYALGCCAGAAAAHFFPAPPAVQSGPSYGDGVAVGVRMGYDQHKRECEDNYPKGEATK